MDTIARSSAKLQRIVWKGRNRRRSQYIGRSAIVLVIVTKLRLAVVALFFFCIRRRAGAIILQVETFDLGSSNSRYVSGTRRETRGTVDVWCAKRQAGLSHAYGAFHYIKPFQCIIYFCVSHLRSGLVHSHRRTEGYVTSSGLKIATDRTDRAAWYTLSSRDDFHGSFASFTPLLRQGFFA